MKAKKAPSEWRGSSAHRYGLVLMLTSVLQRHRCRELQNIGADVQEVAAEENMGRLLRATALHNSTKDISHIEH